eukprot:TRINITY_DN278_c0_g1_i1.p1 TRINITY_DN278_c0_g1~~TRINITY_DN278_c0_g1_i1.p1  ORF type:complete len:319 (+),score=88.01 TRINITY_DN278_c0_g1_i1:123-1079(+)
MIATTAVVQSAQPSQITRTRSKSQPAPRSPILVKSVSTSSLASPSVAYCLPARKTKTTKKTTSTQHPKLTKSTSTSNLASKSSSSTTALAKSSAISNSALKGWIMNLLRISSQKTSPVEVLGPMSSPNLHNQKTTTVVAAPKPPTIVKQAAPKPKPTIPRDTLVRASAFLKLCESHREFFKSCYEIDSYTISMAFNYIQRAVPLIPIESLNTELLFYCLYLAWETEEDSTVGIEGIIHYIIGPFPSSRNKDKITRKYEIMEWKRKLNVFHSGKDKLWRALDFNTYVSQPQCLQTLQLFPAEHEIFKRPRRPEDLRKFF